MEKKYNCEICEYATNDKSNLNRHVKIHNKPLFKKSMYEKRFTCKFCNQGYDRLDSYKRHINSKKHNKKLSFLIPVILNLYLVSAASPSVTIKQIISSAWRFIFHCSIMFVK